MTDYEPLKIAAQDEEDLDILLTLLQDAMMPVVSVVYDKNNQTITFLTNRFCWELPEETSDGQPLFYRVHAGLLFKDVLSVHEKNIEISDKTRILSFLMATFEKKGDDYYAYLFFSDDACIRLQLRSIHCLLADIDEPWSTRISPNHMTEGHCQVSKNI